VRKYVQRRKEELEGSKLNTGRTQSQLSPFFKKGPEEKTREAMRGKKRPAASFEEEADKGGKGYGTSC